MTNTIIMKIVFIARNNQKWKTMFQKLSSEKVHDVSGSCYNVKSCKISPIQCDNIALEQ